MAKEKENKKRRKRFETTQLNKEIENEEEKRLKILRVKEVLPKKKLNE